MAKNAYQTISDPKEIKIQTDPSKPFYDVEGRVEESLDDSMVESICWGGVRHPVECSRHEDEVFIVDGRRRYLHWIEANKRLKARGEEQKPLKVLIYTTKPNDAAGISVICNEHHRAYSPLQKIAKARQLESAGYSVEQIAIKFGVTKACIGQWFDSDSLCAPVKKLVEQGKIAITAASKFADLPAAQQKEEVEKLIESGVKPTVKAAVKAAAGEKVERRVTQTEKNQAFYEAIERLKEKLMASKWKGIEERESFTEFLDKVANLHAGDCTEDEVWEAIDEL